MATLTSPSKDTVVLVPALPQEVAILAGRRLSGLTKVLTLFVLADQFF
ncbi:hypothetical protein [Bacillus sp. REN3]|nr:hypothetical protein [Bacillus sp. REN3]